MMVLAAASTACRRAPAADTTQAPVVAVGVAAARIDTLRDVATASGVVVPSSAGDWVVYAPEPGEVAELPHKEGDTVAIGDVLVRFEIASLTQEMAARQLELTDAQAKSDRAKSEAVRLAGLFDRGLAARAALESARNAQTLAEAAAGQAAAQLQLATVGLERATLRARFPGTIAKIWHQPGEMVTGATDDPVMRVIDQTRLQVSLQLPTPQLARVFQAQTAVVRAIAGAADEPALVANKPGATDPNAATGEVRLSFVQPSTLPLDTPVSAEILLDQRTGALVVPAVAVQRDGANAFVVVVGDDLRAHRRDIRLGLVTRDQVQVVNGLTPGERVIVSGLADVVEDMTVAVAR